MPEAHTTGPWVYHLGCVYADCPTAYPKGKDTGVPIAHMDREPGNGTTPCERDANARLIAASPGLLEVANLIYRLDRDNGPNITGPVWRDMVRTVAQHAREVIAQAVGVCDE